MHAHRKAYHVHGFLYVCRPVAAFFGVVDLVYDDIVVFPAVGCDVVLREPDFAGVLGCCQEVDDVLFFFDNAFFAFLKVCYSFRLKEPFPV